jgi:hypothetical protein
LTKVNDAVATRAENRQEAHHVQQNGLISDKYRLARNRTAAAAMRPLHHDVSDHSKFLQEFPEKKPQLEEEQKTVGAR